jgi:hypothetical protein
MKIKLFKKTKNKPGKKSDNSRASFIDTKIFFSSKFSALLTTFSFFIVFVFALLFWYKLFFKTVDLSAESSGTKDYQEMKDEIEDIFDEFESRRNNFNQVPSFAFQRELFFEGEVVKEEDKNEEGLDIENNKLKLD